MKARALIIGILLLINCKDPIKVDVDGAIGVLVVDGKVTTLPGPYELRLGYTVGTKQKPNPVSFAAAVLYDDMGNSETYTETDKGVYSVPGNVIQGQPGRTYHVEITLANGRTYSSKPETIPAATGADTPSYDLGARSEFEGEVEVKINVFNIYVDTQLPTSLEKPLYLRWDVGETYMFEQTPVFDPFHGTIPKPCYITGWADPQRITLFSTRNLNLQEIKHTKIAVRDLNYSFLTKHWFTIYLNSVTPESYEYWKNVDQLINRTGSIFDTPPAPIEGNVFSNTDADEDVFGYFEATNTSMKRFYVLRSQIPFMLYQRCNDPALGVYYTGYPPECYNCSLLGGSSPDAPEWFSNQ